jgi:thioredoxin-related protein
MLPGMKADMNTMTTKIQPAGNLQELSKLSRETVRPILLLFSQTYCEACHRIKDEILNPMLLNEDDTSRVIMREMLIDEGQTFIDFDGSQKETRELFVDYDMVVTPTLILLDHTGKQLGDKLIGLNTVELYGWYLENAIVYARSLILKSGIH